MTATHHEAPAPAEATRPSFGPLLPLGVASLGAGAIHAAAAAAHGDARQAALCFDVLAVAQLAWGAWAMVGSRRVLAALGAVLSVGAVAGWIVVQTVGIGFIDGFEDPHPIGWADALAAGLAAFVAVVALRHVLAGRRSAPARPSLGLLRATSCAAVVVVTLAGVSQSSHGGHGHGGDGHDHGTPSATPPKVYDPEKAVADAKAAGGTGDEQAVKRVDLSGVPGVTPEQQERAEQLVEINLDKLPQWASQEVAKAKGFHSIGDGFTGAEHLINWNYIDDDHELDPDHPESLVYDTTGPEPKLVSAMYMLPTGSTLDTVPDIGGPLTQWHIHDNLCFTKEPPPRVVGITNGDGNCSFGQKLPPVPMIHVWIVGHPCGPFAALEGVAAGQIKAGEERACDAEHSHDF